MVRCPSCGHDNLAGEDRCENCGADLWAADTPRSAVDFRGRLLGEPLDALRSSPAEAIGADDPVDAAIARMHEVPIDCLLVVDAGRLVGIFTERDAVLKVAGHAAGATTVREVMTRDPVVLRPTDTVAIAIHKMAVGGFRHIPIMDGDSPLGVLAARDVFRHIGAMLG